MSEYWKSTPKIWCKHCKVFVRDTKLEKQNHDATPRHQGNLKRFLRDLHRGQENTEREKERARREVERVTGIVSSASGSGTGSGSGSSSGGGVSGKGTTAISTPTQRKEQLSQLAELGISIPDEFRGDLAMVGEWQVLEEKVIDPEGDEPDPSKVSIGVRKREHREEEEEEEEEEKVVKKKRRWGREYPVEEEGLDELLGRAVKSVRKEEPDAGVKEEDAVVKVEDSKDAVTIKRESPEAADEALNEVGKSAPADTEVKTERGSVAGVIFKKRKAKNVRQK